MTTQKEGFGMRIAIFGYGNLGHGAEVAARAATDVSLVGIFTRRCPSSIVSPFGTPVYDADKLSKLKNSIDVLLICAGSAGDLPVLTPRLAQSFHVVDSFDTHERIKTHFETVDAAARASGHAALIAGGWDPGLFSLARLYAASLLPGCRITTLWGPGISQGHSEAIRRLEGVEDALAFTLPRDLPEEDGEVKLSQEALHRRHCFVLPCPGADRDAIRTAIVNMPHYFRGYQTEVTFVAGDELKNLRGHLPHGGSIVIRGTTGQNPPKFHRAQLDLHLDSNPEFTGSILVGLSRALYRLAKEGQSGAFTLFDIPPSYLCPDSLGSPLTFL